MKTPTQVLQEARVLISEPECWTQHQAAARRDGTRVSADDPSAVAWCALGALGRCSRGNAKVAAKAREKLEQGIPRLVDSCVINFNDTHTHAEVLALFDRAILAETAK